MSAMLLAQAKDYSIFTKLVDFLTGGALPEWGIVVAGGVIGFLIALIPAITVLALFATWAERKVAGHIQCRYGPMRVGGWHGWAQALADGVKLLLKEDLIPRGADRKLFVLAPALVLGAGLGAYCALPLGPELYFAKIDLGVLFVVAIAALTTIGVIMAGWASNNKWSILGSMREAAQVVSYEIPLALGLMIPIMQAGTVSFHEVIEFQGTWNGAGWMVFRSPFVLPAFLLFWVALLAETRRAPFDLPESESELVAGFHTEYSGIRFSFFFLEEYAAMFLGSAVAAAFFWGGWHAPGLHGLLGDGVAYQVGCAAVLIAKGMFGVFLMMWIRWTLPRLRIDQVMITGYKYLTPIGFFLLIGQALWVAYVLH